MAENRPGAHPHPFAPVLDRHAAEMASNVHQDAFGLSLTVEARPAAAQRHRDAAAAAVGENPGHVLGAPGEHDGLRDHAVGAGVGGVADEVDRPAEDAAGAHDRRQVRA